MAKIEIQLHPDRESREKALRSMANIGYLNVWEGAVRSGKTVFALCAFAIYAVRSKETSFLLSGRTVKTIEKNCITEDFGLLNLIPGSTYGKVGESKAVTFYVRQDGQLVKKSIFVAAMNFRCEGGGVPMAPHASATDGQLSACCVYGIPRLLCLFCFPFLIAGRHEGIRGFDVINTSQMHVVFDRPMVVHADGEDCGDQTDVTFRCIPGALRMPHLDLDVATR